MTIEKALTVLENQGNNFFQRAAAYSQIISYCDEKLKLEDTKKISYLTTAQNFIRKSKQKFLFLEVENERMEISRSDDLTSQDIGNAIFQLEYLKSYLEDKERATRELKERTEKIGQERTN